MVVLLKGDDDRLSRFDVTGVAHSSEFIPGPVYPEQLNFIKAYDAMATKADWTLAEAVEKRYEYLEEVKVVAQNHEDFPDVIMKQKGTDDVVCKIPNGENVVKIA